MPSSRAIVLSRENFGEADRYIQFFSKEWGLISALAKSARKSKRRYVGGMDLFCHNEISLRGDPKEKPYLVELTVLNPFPGIREDYDRVMTAGKIVQWVRRLCSPATAMPGVYSLLGQSLALIEKQTDAERLHLLRLVFQLKLLNQLGLKPRMDVCARCSQPANRFRGVFDFDAGGVLCETCLQGHSPAHHLLLSESQYQLLAQGDSVALTLWDQFSSPPQTTRHLLHLVTQFASFHTHTHLPC